MPVNRSGLTLLEILISIVILALVTTGLANVFVAGKQFIQHSRYRMSAGEIGKKFIDPLQYYVRQDTWNTSCFSTDALANATSGNYTAVYTVSNISNNTNNTTVKKVKAAVSWTE